MTESYFGSAISIKFKCAIKIDRRTCNHLNTQYDFITLKFE